MERPARMPGQPSSDFGVLVAAVIVEDHMDQFAGRDVALEAVEKTQKLLVAVPLHALADDRAVEHVEGGEQGCRAPGFRSGQAIADIVVGHRPGAARLHRQAGLGTIEGLDLAFLIDREHQAVRRRVDIKSDHVAHLDGKLRITAELEDPQPVWGEAMGAPDFLHCADRQPHRLGHRATGPMRRLARRRAERAGDQAADHRVGDRRFAGLPRLVAQQPLNPGRHKAVLPAPHAGFGHPGPAHDLDRAAAFGRRQDDLRPPHMLLRAVAIGHDRFQPLPIPRSKPDFDALLHPRIIAQNPIQGNLLYRSYH